MGSGRACTRLAALAALALLGCGGSSPGEARRLSTGEEAQVQKAQLAVSSYCRRIELYIAGRRGPATGADSARVNAALDKLIALAREKPKAKDRNQETASEVLGDIAEDLEGSNCAPNLEHRIDQALESLPPG